MTFTVLNSEETLQKLCADNDITLTQLSRLSGRTGPNLTGILAKARRMGRTQINLRSFFNYIHGLTKESKSVMMYITVNDERTVFKSCEVAAASNKLVRFIIDQKSFESTKDVMKRCGFTSYSDMSYLYKPHNAPSVPTLLRMLKATLSDKEVEIGVMVDDKTYPYITNIL